MSLSQSQVVRFSTRRQGLQRVRTGCATCKYVFRPFCTITDRYTGKETEFISIISESAESNVTKHARFVNAANPLAENAMDIT